MGRPTKLTPERQERIVALIRDGNYPETAAIVAGISAATFYNWMARGREWQDSDDRVPAAERPFVEFLEAVIRAEAEAEAVAVHHLKRAGADDWRANVEYLKRRKPREWGALQQVEVTNRDRTAEAVDPETVGELEAAYAAAFGGELEDFDPESILPSLNGDGPEK